MTVIGIDPGAVNLGFAVTHDGISVKTLACNPRKLTPGYSALCNLLWEEAGKPTEGYVLIERFVSYQDTLTAAGEDILMIIGALTGFFTEKGLKVSLVRAIEWKTKLCTYLVKEKRFQNPGKEGSMDKKFSFAAFEACWETKVKTDHEADAGCLAYLANIAVKRVKE